MTNYYLTENGLITQSADWKFNENCLETQEEIVRDGLSGELFLKSNYDTLITTDNYKKKVRLAEIEAELNSADDTYTTYLDTPVQYINGFYYKPKYVQETYISLITAGTINPSLFPMVIWDSTELEENAVSMSLSELISLTTYLAGVQQIAFNSRKQQRASLIVEQQSLLQSS